MKADLKKQKLQQRESERRQRRWKMTIVAGLAILAGGFALTSFTPDVASSETPTPGGFRRITADELKPQFDRGEVTIIDVRDADPFVQSHIPGALQIPLARIEGEIAYLPKGKPIVTYCNLPGRGVERPGGGDPPERRRQRSRRAARRPRRMAKSGLPTGVGAPATVMRGGHGRVRDLKRGSGIDSATPPISSIAGAASSRAPFLRC